MSAKNDLAPCTLFVGIVFLMAATFAAAQADHTRLHAPASGAFDSTTPASITSTAIPPDFFDMSAHDGVLYGTPWPTMPIYGLRLWDTDTAWAQLNTASGVYDWTVLDSWIAAAASHNTELIYTFGQTPAWASSDPNDENCDYAPGTCWPPNDLNSDGTGTDQHWIDFVTAIAQHAPSIQLWEMWNTPHDTNQWNGTDAQLVRMVQDARTYILKYIPTATIIGPANGQLNYSYPSGNCVMPDKMAGYLAAGLGKYIDVMAFHTYYTIVPEDIVPVIQCYQSTMAAYNISSMPLWSTEGAWGTNTELTSSKAQAGFLARLYLLLWSNGVARHYWYDWNDDTTGTLEVNNVTNTAGTAYAQVESWMSGRTMSTLCAENSSGIWTCGLTGPDGYTAQAVWYPGGNKTYTPPSGFINYLDLGGVQHTISSTASVTVGIEPILLQNQSTSKTETPTFVFSAGAFPNVKVGSTGTSAPITISSEYGFAGTVNLTCPATFGTGSCSISPSTVSTFPATATLVINGTSFSAGAYQMAVQGTSGSITASYNVSFNVGDYTISGPASLSAGSTTPVSANFTLTSLYGYSGQVNATCDATSLPGAVCTLTPANPITVGDGAAVPVTATITVPTAAALGSYNIVITAQDVTGNPSHSATMTLAAGQDFSLGSITPSTLTVAQGQSAAYNFSVLPVGSSFSNPVSFSCSGAPAGTLCSFSPSTVTPGSASVAVAMTVSTTASSAGVAPQQRRRTPSFYAVLLALPGLVLLTAGSSGKRRRRFHFPASLFGLFLLTLLFASCGGTSSNAAATSGGAGGTTGGGQAGTTPGTYSVIVTGTSGTLTHQTSAVTLVVSQ